MAGNGQPSAAEKRKAEDGADGEDGAAAAKRARLDAAASAAAPAAAPGKPRAALDPAVLEKAKKALQLQKELKERMKNLKAPLPPPPAPPPAAAPAPADALAPPPPGGPGRGGGRGAGRGAGRGRGRGAGAEAPAPAPAAEAPAPEADARFFDAALGGGAARRAERRAPRGALQFVEEGRFQKEAEAARLRARYGPAHARALEERRRREAAAEAAGGGGDANAVPLGARPAAPPAEPPPPDVEWWDARLLADRGAGGYGSLEVRPGRVTALVEHPVPVEPPAEAPPPPPQPLRLTARELKKLRTQRRTAREAERRELLAQGLIEPPKPRVRLANMMRVLGAEAAADPTAVEAEVRRQAAERAAAHADRNLARALAPHERREKKLRKLLGAGAAAGGAPPAGVQVAVYKVGSLARPQLRFKVDANAKENHLTGAALLADGAGFALVVVEGGDKPQRRYEKLMLRRIDWAADADEAGGGGAGGEGGEGEGGAPPNYCHRVWRGVAAAPAFRKFRTETLGSAAAARAFLEGFGCAHFWDVAEAYAPE